MAKITTDTFKLLVYGTLKRGECRNHVLRGETYLKDVKTLPHYKLLNLGSYPGLVRVENDGRAVEGELYEVHTPLKEMLDRIEGSPNLFRLEEVEIDGEEGPVYCYFFKVRLDDVEVIESNRW